MATDGRDSEFEQLCKKLRLADHIVESASSIKQQIEHSSFNEAEAGKHNWSVCSIYIAVVEWRFTKDLLEQQTAEFAESIVSVTDILRSADLRTTDFFHAMKVIKDNWSLSSDVLQHLVQVERKFLIACPLFNKFEKIFDEVFINDSSVSSAVDRTENVEILNSERKKFCWIMFIHIKSTSHEHSTGRKELVFSFHLLLCCLAHVITTTPASKLRPPFGNSAGQLNEDNDVLKQLCSMYKADYMEAKSVQMNYINDMIQNLPQTNDTMVDQIKEKYISVFRAIGDINELDFLTGENYLFIQRSSSPPPSVAVAEEPTPEPSQLPPGTPISKTMNSVNQLMSLIASHPDTPSDCLQTYTESCTKEMAERVKQLKDNFIEKFVLITGSRQSAIAELRFNHAVRLYYRVLESMLLIVNEERRLGQKDFSQLLNNTVFHKGVLACAVEVVLITYEVHTPSSLQSPSESHSSGSLSILFPWILSVFGLTAYDFFRVLEGFIRAENKLPADVIKHLRSVENRILEQLAWHHDSPVHGMIRRMDSNQHQLAEPSEPSTLFEQISSSTDDKMLVDSPTASDKLARSLNVFFSKVLRLAYQRLQTLSSALGVSNDLMQKIWTCLDYCIVKQPSLLCDRHIDQILMCCIYAISKVVDKEIRFKAIVNEYRLLPHASQQVFKRVLISGSDYDSIITFYNKVFMQLLKSYILQFSSNKVPTGLTSPVLKPLPSPLRASPKYPLPGRQNFYVSPLRVSEFKSPMSPSCMTPRTRHLYSFGEGSVSGEKLRAFNEQMRRASPVCQSSTSKCLKFDGADDCEMSALPTRLVEKFTGGRKVPASRKSLQFNAD